MQKAELYLEDDLYIQLQQKAKQAKLTLSEYIENLLKTTIKKDEKISFKEIVGIWNNKDINIEDIRNKAWK